MRALVLFLLLLTPGLTASPLPSQSGQLLVVEIGEGGIASLDLTGGTRAPFARTGKGPHEIVLSPDGQRALVPNYGGTSIAIVDLATAGVRRIPLETPAADQGGGAFHGGAWTPDGRHVLVTRERSGDLLIVPIDDSGGVVTIPTGQRRPHMVLLEPGGRRAFTTCKPGGTLCVIDMEKRTRIQTLETGAGAQGMAFHPERAELWVANIIANTVSVIDLGTLKETREFEVPDYPVRLAFTPDGCRLLLTHYRPGLVSIFETDPPRSLKTVTLTPLTEKEAAAKPLPPWRADCGRSPLPVGLLVRPDGKFAYVACTRGDRIVEIDLTTLTVSRSLAMGHEPDGMIWRPETNARGKGAGKTPLSPKDR